jgi:hypothetical protein
MFPAAVLQGTLYPLVLHEGAILWAHSLGSLDLAEREQFEQVF